ncbi:MAG: ATP-grasp domain-containing protein [Oscillospiraceae bacterium]|nr:ATP-grasp domain-containing protein [Oscillospiraceae bacterium]
MVAVVTDVHYRMSLALIRDLGQAGVRVITCERSGQRPAPGAVSRWSARHVWLPDDRWPEALAELCRKTGEQYGCRPALLPVGAASLSMLADRTEEFSAISGLCIPARRQLDLLNSKSGLSELAARLQIPVPESFRVRGNETIQEFSARIPLPCVIKPVCGEKLGLPAESRYIIARTPAEAGAAYQHFLTLAKEPPVVQAWLSGGGLGCSVLAQDGKVQAVISHRRLREYPLSGGPSTCCRCENRPDLLELVSRIVSEIRLTGLSMFEFKEDSQGRPYLLEANPRIWGTFPLTRAAHSNIPLLWCTLSWNAGNPDAPMPRPSLPQPLPRKMVFAASDLTGGAIQLRHGHPIETVHAILDVLNPAVPDGLFELRDPRPGMAYLKSVLFRHGNNKN